MTTFSSDPDPNKPETTPAESAAPVVASAPDPGGSTAESYIALELQRAKGNLQNTRIWGTLFVVLVSGYLLYLTGHFAQALQPHDAAEIASGMINQQVEDKGPDLAAQIKQKIPEYIAQTPDYVLQELPKYRASIADRVEADLNRYCQNTSQQLGQTLDTYLEQHKDEIKGMLTTPNDPAITKRVGDSLKQQLMTYIREQPQNGETLGVQIDKSLASLQELGSKLHRLAANKNLKPEEQKTRRAIAILTASIDKQNLPQVPVPSMPSNNQ